MYFFGNHTTMDSPIQNAPLSSHYNDDAQFVKDNKAKLAKMNEQRKNIPLKNLPWIRD